MTQRLLRNWSSISTIRCPLTRAALVSCKDPLILKSFAQAFPACFRTAEEGEIDRIPWSRILHAAAQGYANSLSDGPPEHGLSGQDHYWHKYIWEDAAKRDEDMLSLPIVATWFNSWNLDYLRPAHESDGKFPPAEIMQQLLALQKSNVQGPLYVSFKNVRCVVGWLHCDNCVGALHKLDLSFIEDLVLINADAIAFDC